MRTPKCYRGLTLLEVMVALLILSVVVVGYLEMFHASHRLVASSREWSIALADAVDGMEAIKRWDTSVGRSQEELLPGGFRRQIALRPWQPGLREVTVTVLFPTGGRFELHRLQESPLSPALKTSESDVGLTDGNTR